MGGVRLTPPIASPVPGAVSRESTKADTINIVMQLERNLAHLFPASTWMYRRLSSLRLFRPPGVKQTGQSALPSYFSSLIILFIEVEL